MKNSMPQAVAFARGIDPTPQKQAFELRTIMYACTHGGVFGFDEVEFIYNAGEPYIRFTKGDSVGHFYIGYRVSRYAIQPRQWTWTLHVWTKDPDTDRKCSVIANFPPIYELASYREIVDNIERVFRIARDDARAGIPYEEINVYTWDGGEYR